jgi:hypothetical protein
MLANVLEIRALLAACSMPDSCLAYSSTLKTEVKYSPETSVDFTGPHGAISQKVELFSQVVSVHHLK